MGRLEGKVALITGGARGQGATEVKFFASHGAKVAFVDILEEEGKHVEAEVREAGGEATFVHMNVSNEDDWIEVIDLVESKYGGLNILVNNAAIGEGFNLDDTTEELWEKIMAVNATGVFLGTKHAIPAMRRAGGGSIVNISSIGGIIARDYPAYAASKGAVRAFTRVTALQHAKDNIRCNTVFPGPIQTPMIQFGDEDRGSRGVSQPDIPLGRRGTTEELAYGVLYLASDEAEWVTGSELAIDGGVTAQ